MNTVAENAMLIHDGKPAKVPFIIWSPAPFICSAVGETQDDFYLNVERKMHIQIKAVDMFPETWIVPGVWPDFGAVLEPSMFGSKIKYMKNDAPQASAVIEDLEDIPKIKFNWKDSLLPEMLSQYEYMWKNLPQHYIDDYGFLDGVGYALGPVETACLLTSMGDYMIGTIEEPELIHQLMDVVTDGLIFSLLEQQKINGKLKKIYLPEHCSNQMGRECFEEFCVPYMKRITDEFADCKFILYHNEGRQIHIADLLPEFRTSITHFGDSIEELAPKLDKDIVLMGNLHPIRDMLHKTPDELYAMTMKLLSKAPTERLWLSTAGGMAPGTPIENVRAVIRALDDYNAKQ